MVLYPVNLNIDGRSCLVIGGGEVAGRKVQSLLAANAGVTVMSPGITPLLADLVAAGQVRHIPAAYYPESIENFFIVICATDDPDVNRAAAAEARAKGALVNVVDAPDYCDFTVPASISRGDLLLTVSTGGKSPAFARQLRAELEGHYGPEYGIYLELIAKVREQIKECVAASAQRGKFWQEAIDAEVLELLKAGRIVEAEEKLKNAVRSVRS